MNAEKLLEILHVAERLKDTPRHCYTSGGRRESVAEHSWRIALMAYLVRDEFPDADMDKVILMCLIHDLGEAFTGDIPTFLKTGEDEKKEEELLTGWIQSFPEPFRSDMLSLYKEMADRTTLAENEYELNLTYGNDKAAFSPYLTHLRQAIREETLRKMEEA